MLGSMGMSQDMLTPAAVYLLFHAGVFKLAWTILLVWALLEPVARRFVLLLTVLITVGIEASAVYLLVVENTAVRAIIPLLILPVVIGGLFAAAYCAAGSIGADQGS